MSDNVLAALDHLASCPLTRDEWFEVGIDLYHTGYSFEIYNEWCKRDPKGNYNENKIRRNWESFADKTPNTNPGGYIVFLATRYGFVSEATGIKPGGTPSISQWQNAPRVQVVPHQTPPKTSYCLGELPNVDMQNQRPENEPFWSQLQAYLSACYRIDETFTVCPYIDSDGISLSVADLYKNLGAGKHKSLYELGFHNDTNDCYNVINPATGRKNADVTAYRFALVESDVLPLDDQLRLILNLRLPCAALVFSGNKSYHAIVHVDAKDKEEYSARVQLLYDICKDNGLLVDESCKNPARLTRLPGFIRTPPSGTTAEQRLIATNEGARNWDEWLGWINLCKKQHDNMERANNSGIRWYTFNELTGTNALPAPPDLIRGLLTRGEVMAIVAPRKAGKSLFLAQLGIEAVRGGKFLDYEFTEPLNVLLFGLESDPGELSRRLESQRKALGIGNASIFDNYHLFPCGASSIFIDDVIREVELNKREDMLNLVIIDPLYMLEEGDENNSDVMKPIIDGMRTIAQTCNGAVIVTHHHKKYGAGEADEFDSLAGSSFISRGITSALDMRKISLDGTNAGEWVREQSRKTEDGKEFFPTPWRIRQSEGRYHPKSEDLDVILDYPLWTLAPAGLFENDPITGTREAERLKGGAAKKELAVIERARNIRLVKQAARECDIGNIPKSRDNIYDALVVAFEQEDVEPPGRKTFYNWCTPGKKEYPFHFEGRRQQTTLVFDDEKTPKHAEGEK